MGGFSIWHWLVLGVIVLLLFGKGRFSDMMGDVAKGMKSFKQGMSEDDAKPDASPTTQGRIEVQPPRDLLASPPPANSRMLHPRHPNPATVARARPD